MNRFLCLFLIAALLACAPVPSNVKVIVGGTLLDPSGKPAVDHAVIVVEGDTVRAVGPQAMVPIPAGSHKVDGTGKSIAPVEGTGPVEAGKAANFVLISGGRIERTMKNGEWVESR
jgi:imidazolonepropionase-like amidohydrolase